MVPRAVLALCVGTLLLVSCPPPGGLSGTSATTSGSLSSSTTSMMTTTSAASSASSGEATLTTEAGSTMTTASSTGCGFLGCGDVGEQSCDQWAQDCPEGQKCMPYADDMGSNWNALKCTSVDPRPDAVGEPCTVTESQLSGIDSCELGALCWNVDPQTLTGYCIALCSGSVREPSCPEGSSCNVLGEGIVTFCLLDCSPLDQNCPDGYLCTALNGNRFGCSLDVSGEAGFYGDPCDFAGQCDPGLVCRSGEEVPGCMSDWCCTPLCDISQPNTCPGEKQSCIPWFDEGDAPAGQNDVGVCATGG